jgi:hypothetical protein
MEVFDVDGKPVGRVAYVQLSDQDVVTTEGEGPLVISTFDDEEPDVPEPMRSQLIRNGFVKIDGPGPELLDTDYYARADWIESVVGNMVTLNVHGDELIKEGRHREGTRASAG